ncbi:MULTISPECIES: PQQ-binding-like beta-propeller repeat protein [unclassified Nocardiopsis]|uniref:outer membrane protein assembly factor BamB family protein n=1 Tax=Nocardiopsis TaxID=2013 RepID=UPI00387B8979
MFLLAGCSFFGVESSTHEPGEAPEYREVVEEVSWTWEAPRGSESVAIAQTGQGALVILDNGAVALSGETGEELWSYRDTDRELLGVVTDNGAHVVLHDEEESWTVVLERDTGRVVHEYTLDLSELDHIWNFSSWNLRDELSGVTGDTWVLADSPNSISSFDLDTGEAVWSAEDVPNCPHEGWVDDLVVWDEVVVAATTCFEQPEDQESVARTVGWDFTSEFVGLNPETGEELWRVEHSIGETPSDSLDREIVPRPGGLVLVRHAYPHKWGISLLDVEAGEATDLKETELLWTSPDGSLLGLWDTETGDYRIQSRSGRTERTLDRGDVSMRSDLVADGYRVGLAGGVLYISDRVDDASAPEGFARFEGAGGSSVFTLSSEGELGVHSAISVPGAVAVLFTSGDGRGVMGLR